MPSKSRLADTRLQRARDLLDIGAIPVKHLENRINEGMSLGPAFPRVILPQKIWNKTQPRLIQKRFPSEQGNRTARRETVTTVEWVKRKPNDEQRNCSTTPWIPGQRSSETEGSYPRGCKRSLPEWNSQSWPHQNGPQTLQASMMENVPPLSAVKGSLCEEKPPVTGLSKFRRFALRG